MKYKLLFSDIDGTLLNAHRELSVDTIAEIQRIKNNIPIILISSRMPSAMTHLQAELGILDQPMICYNGGLILVQGKAIHSTVIKPRLIKHLLQFNSTNNAHISLYHNDNWYVEEMDYWANREVNNTKVMPQLRRLQDVLDTWQQKKIGAHKIMCMGDAEKIDRIHNFLTEEFGDKLHLYRSKDTYLEIANNQISKLTAINKLLKTVYKTDLDQVIAFGDNYNDIEMLEAVGLGVAVANAKSEVLDIADEVTLANVEDGVAKAIQKHF